MNENQMIWEQPDSSEFMDMTYWLYNVYAKGRELKAEYTRDFHPSELLDWAKRAKEEGKIDSGFVEQVLAFGQQRMREEASEESEESTRPALEESYAAHLWHECLDIVYSKMTDDVGIPFDDWYDGNHGQYSKRAATREVLTKLKHHGQDDLDDLAEHIEHYYDGSAAGRFLYEIINSFINQY
jgi:phosphoribosyl-ATP pyrophosphohydrolase